VIREPSDEPAASRETLTDVWPEAQVQAAAALLRECYGSAKPQGGEVSPAELPKLLETALEAPRADWPTGLCRRLWDFLSEVADQRRRSPQHLGRWYHLVGYCLRPGFGDPLDRHRVDQLWKMLNAPPRVEPGKPVQRLQEGGADFWIMWRRVCGGLPGPLQSALSDRLRPVLLPGKGKNVVRPGANELAEMWRAAGSLERLGLAAKEAMGQVLLKTIKRPPVPTYTFWSLTRLGARSLLYGPLNVVLHPETVEGWLDVLLPFEPSHPSERMAWAFCLAQLARRTGQRALDIDDGHRERVLAALRSQSIPPHWTQMVDEVVESEADEQSQMFGESLPIGLKLIKAGD
jgi:DNA-K related protein